MKGFSAKNLLFALTFESVDFKAKTICFVIHYPDLVELVDKTKAWLRTEDETKPIN